MNDSEETGIETGEERASVLKNKTRLLPRSRPEYFFTAQFQET